MILTTDTDTHRCGRCHRDLTREHYQRRYGKQPDEYETICKDCKRQRQLDIRQSYRDGRRPRKRHHGKTCTRCYVYKAPTAFYDTGPRLASWCQACVAEAVANHRQEARTSRATQAMPDMR